MAHDGLAIVRADQRKKIFIAYRFTGEPTEALTEMIECTTRSLAQAGFNAFSSFPEEDNFLQAGMNPGDIIDHMCRKLPSVDALLVIVKSTEKSEGMLIEVGYRNALRDHGIKNIALVLAVKHGVHTHLRFIADTVIEFDTLPQLYERLSVLSREVPQLVHNT